MRISKGYLYRYFLPFWVVFTYLFMYIPVIVLVVFSFNSNPFSYDWHHFTLSWYCELLASTEVWHALQNSLVVACSAVVLTLLLALLFVCFATSYYLSITLIMFYSMLAVPEILLAVGMLSFFSFGSIPLGFTTLIAGHTLIGLGYVVPILYNRFVDIDQDLIEASLDLGATRVQTFFIIILPLMLPALISAGLLVFIVSMDDFIFSFFCTGPSMQTLPLYIFSLIRSGATPMVNALSTLLLLASTILVFIFSLLSFKKMGDLE